MQIPSSLLKGNLLYVLTLLSLLGPWTSESSRQKSSSRSIVISVSGISMITFDSEIGDAISLEIDIS